MNVAVAKTPVENLGHNFALGRGAGVHVADDVASGFAFRPVDEVAKLRMRIRRFATTRHRYQLVQLGWERIGRRVLIECAVEVARDPSRGNTRLLGKAVAHCQPCCRVVAAVRVHFTVVGVK